MPTFLPCSQCRIIYTTMLFLKPNLCPSKMSWWFSSLAPSRQSCVSRGFCKNDKKSASLLLTGCCELEKRVGTPCFLGSSGSQRTVGTASPFIPAATLLLPRSETCHAEPRLLLCLTPSSLEATVVKLKIGHHLEFCNL